MATHYQSCKEIFKERVLPHFPHAKERFKNHFRESYGLIKDLKVYLSENRDTAWRPGPTCSELGLNLFLALTILGAKPLVTSVREQEIAGYGYIRLRDAGLDIYKEKNSVERFYDGSGKIMNERQTVWIYDPVLLAPMLSETFNVNAGPENVRKILKRFEREAGSSHTLLGYPEKGRVRNGQLTYSRYAFDVVNCGRLNDPDLPYYSEAMGSRVISLEKSRGKLEAWALAAAMVEEIREAGSSIVSHAGILENGWKKPRGSTDIIVIDPDEKNQDIIIAEVMVRRQKGGWLVLKSSV